MENNFIDESLVNHDLTKNFEKLKGRLICSICDGLLNSSLIWDRCRNPFYRNCIENESKCPICVKKQNKSRYKFKTSQATWYESLIKLF